MVFRRESKVDQFQRQMNNLRHQIGDAEPGQDDDTMNVPDIADERFPETDFDERLQDAGGYSFGSYPAAPQAQQTDEQDDRALAVPEMPGVDSQISVVAEGTLWKGEVEADGSIHVFGRVEGTLTAKEDIWIAEGADVQATVTARQVIVAGQVNGTVHALNRFEALPQGVVEADVKAPSFVVHEGATINGNLTMSTNDSSVSSGRAERAGSTPVVQRRIRPGS